MRIVYALAIVAGAVSACSNEQPLNQSQIDAINESLKTPEERAADKARAESKAAANANLDKIAYPTCTAAVEGGRVTSCGKKVFVASMAECRSRALGLAPSGSLLDEYAGDSWQERAGRSSLMNDKDRLAGLARNPDQLHWPQYVAVALANGTDVIQNFACDLDGRLRLKSVDRS
jgi:hypothetical protein